MPIVLYRGGMATVQRISTWWRDRPFLADLAFALGLCVLAIVATAAADVDPSEQEANAFAWLLLVGICLPVAFRRIAPIAATWTMLVFNGIYWVADFPDEATGMTLLIGVYSIGAHVDRPRSLRHGMGVIGGIVTVGIAGVISPEDDLPWFAIPAFLIMYGTAWILGDNVRTRRAYMVELERTAAHAEAQRQAEARHAVADERTRIARELHDVVAHEMTVMTIQAAAAQRVLDKDPQKAAEALDAIEAAGHDALAEMRRLLGLLRTDEHQANHSPQPGLQRLDGLVEQMVEAGLSIDVVVEGTPRPLPAGVDLNAYRIIQESLTNTLKHGGPDVKAQVHLDFADTELGIEVTDNGRGAAEALVAGDSGHGLLGMQERIALLDGDFASGPRPGGGYRVAAKIPVRT